jgi:thioredoxin 1
MTTPRTVTDQEFEEAVLHSDTLVLVDFWATWCAGCRMVAPILDELANEYVGRVTVVKANVDEAPAHTTHYQVRRTPTIILFRQGQELDRIEGVGRKATYTQKIDTLLG